jgi:hypothetical protein
MPRSKLKVGVHAGGGPPPGYLWNVAIAEFAYDEAMKFLDEDQYSHLAGLFQELARHEDPTHSLILSVEAIEDFHELRDKGGVLRNLNVRVFYYVDKRAGSRTIVVLGAIVKQNNGPTPQAVKVRIRRRVRTYLAGEYGSLLLTAESGTPLPVTPEEGEVSGP